MFIAQKLKKENIVEYLLYMWQIEDTIRAFGLDMECINSNILSGQQLKEEEKILLYEWYENLISMMRFENVQEKGHLQINKNIISELDELHKCLLSSGKDAAYPAKFYHILPFIHQLKSKYNSQTISDIEVCFNFLYGILLLRMKKAAISDETIQVLEQISKFMVLLAKKYNSYKAGQYEFD